jgi:hypothetical protein
MKLSSSLGYSTSLWNPTTFTTTSSLFLICKLLMHNLHVTPSLFCTALTSVKNLDQHNANSFWGSFFFVGCDYYDQKAHTKSTQT